MYLDVWNAENKFWEWGTIFGYMSYSLSNTKAVYLPLRPISLNSGLFQRDKSACVYLNIFSFGDFDHSSSGGHWVKWLACPGKPEFTYTEMHSEYWNTWMSPLLMFCRFVQYKCNFGLYIRYMLPWNLGGKKRKEKKKSTFVHIFSSFLFMTNTGFKTGTKWKHFTKLKSYKDLGFSIQRENKR